MENTILIITPKTKVMHLIETYPQLEDILIGYVPAFKKLKNPVLRKTVARIATLQQAANVGNVNISDLINVLRKAVGQELLAEMQYSQYNSIKPHWFDENQIKQVFDVREMLSSGAHPVNQVMADLRNFPEKSIYKLVAPFLPAPLIDKASSMEYQHWIVKESDELFIVYFCK